MTILTLLACNTVASAEQAGDVWLYTVKDGENLWGIARAHLQSLSMVPALQQQNGIRSPYDLKVGSTLRIPLSWMKQHVSNATVSDLIGQADLSGQALATGQVIKLQAGKEIRTGRNSRLKLIMEDGSLVSLGTQSVLHIHTATHFPSTGTNSNLLELQKGNIENLILKNTIMPTRHNVATPSAITAVRGTRFRINISEPGRSSTEVREGQVAVDAVSQQQALQGGEGNITIEGQAPGKNQPLPPPPVLSGNPAVQTVNPAILRWQPAKGIRHHQLTLIQQKPVRRIIDDALVNGSHYFAPLEDGEYTLQISSQQDDGLQGPPAELTFNQGSSLPPPLVLMPQDQDRQRGLDFELHLAGTNGASHLLQLSSQADMRKPIETTARGQIIRQMLPSAGIWYWRVAQQGANGQTGTFSEVRSLHAGSGFWQINRRYHAMISGQPYPLADAVYQLQIKNLSREEKVLTLESRSPIWNLRETLFPGKYALQVTVESADGYRSIEPPRQLQIN